MARAQVVQTGIGWRRDQVLRVFHLLLLPIRGTWCVDVNGVTHEVTAPDGGLFVPVQNNRRLYTQSEGTADYSHEAVIVLIDPLHFQWSQQVALVGNAGRTLAAGLWGLSHVSVNVSPDGSEIENNNSRELQSWVDVSRLAWDHCYIIACGHCAAGRGPHSTNIN